MRTTTRTVKKVVEVIPMAKRKRAMTAVIELHVSDLKINLVGDHCKHCEIEHKHIFSLAGKVLTV